jgi:hypothetical protein
LLQSASRKIPVAIWIGSRDQYFPLSVVRNTRDVLQRHGFPVQLTEMPGYDHDYYSHDVSVNNAAWSFLKRQSLATPPVWEIISAGPG